MTQGPKTCRRHLARCRAVPQATGVAAIATVYPVFGDLDGLAAHAAHAARGVRDGVSGMIQLHTSQVGVINEAFTPSPEAQARARHIVDAFAANPVADVVNLDREMLDAPHLR